MSEDLIKFNDKEYGIAFTSAKIDFPEYPKLKAQVDGLHDEFMNYDVTTENLKSAKATRAKLNKFAKAINSKKIEIVRNANKPVNQFEEDIKTLVQESKEASEHINQQIKAYELKAKEQRHDYNIKRIIKMCEEFGVDSADVLEAEDGYNPKWDNKNFSNAQFEKEVKEKIDQAKKMEEQFAANQRLVAQEADKLGLPADHWLEVLNNGTPIDQLIKSMNHYKQELAEISKKQEEAKQERAKEDAKLLHKEGKAIDPSTGEVKDKVYTVLLKVTATKPQLEQLARYFKDWNIDVERVRSNGRARN